MTLNPNSYGSVAEVTALTRLYLRGQSAYNSTTRPTLTDVEAFINRASGVMNLALSEYGFQTPITQSDAVFAVSQWVIERAAEMVEKAQPTSAYGTAPNAKRKQTGPALAQLASEFVVQNTWGFKNLGVVQQAPIGRGLTFTGQDAQRNRADPQNTDLAQPEFTRGQFDAQSDISSFNVPLNR